MNSISVRDRRKFPMQINWELDDLRLSDSAFRVYIHLVRRAGKDDSCFPSCRSIGQHCWPNLSESRARRKATECIQELAKFNLVQVQTQKREDGGYSSNLYILNDCSEWTTGRSHTDQGDDQTVIRGRSASDAGADQPVIGGMITQRSHKKTNKEVNQKEVNQKEDSPYIPPGGEGEIKTIDVEVVDPDVPKNLGLSTEVETEPLNNPANPDNDQNSAEVDEKVKGGNYLKPEDLNAQRQQLSKLGVFSGGKWDQGYLEVIRRHLASTSHYKGKACTVWHAKRYCDSRWKSGEDLGALIAHAEAAIITPLTQSGLSLEVEAILKASEARRQAKQSNKLNPEK